MEFSGSWFAAALKWLAASVVVLLIALLVLMLRPLYDPQAAVREIPPTVIIENGLGADREQFYSLPEGSEMIPLVMAKVALREYEPSVENKRSETIGHWIRRFTTNRRWFLEDLERFGFIPVPVSPDNPLGYVGLTVAERPLMALHPNCPVGPQPLPEGVTLRVLTADDPAIPSPSTDLPPPRAGLCMPAVPLYVAQCALRF